MPPRQHNDAQNVLFVVLSHLFVSFFSDIFSLVTCAPGIGGSAFAECWEFGNLQNRLWIRSSLHLFTMDFQNRVGGKTGGGGAASAGQEAIHRRERLRKLALETVDLQKDPYFMRNHVGQYECKLCLTIHPNEGNYLAHTQGKRHQEGLAKRAAMDAALKAQKPQE